MTPGSSLWRGISPLADCVFVVRDGHRPVRTASRITTDAVHHVRVSKMENGETESDTVPRLTWQ
jgi:hypothetical protein